MDGLARKARVPVRRDAAAKRARLGAAERAALEALPHRYVEDLSGLLPLIGITGGPPAGSGGLAELRNTPD